MGMTLKIDEVNKLEEDKAEEVFGAVVNDGGDGGAMQNGWGQAEAMNIDPPLANEADTYGEVVGNTNNDRDINVEAVAKDQHVSTTGTTGRMV